MLGSMRPTTLSLGPSLCSKRKEWLRRCVMSTKRSMVHRDSTHFQGPSSLPNMMFCNHVASARTHLSGRPSTYSCSYHQDVKVGAWRWRGGTVSGIVRDQGFCGLRDLSCEGWCFNDNMARCECHGSLTGGICEERSRVGKSNRFCYCWSDRR